MKTVLLCLHGWGGSKESFTELRAALEGSGIEILTPDLPGFGSEPEPKAPWTVDDYADWVVSWLGQQKLEMSGKKLEKLFVLGHSHGGRIALTLAARQSGKLTTNLYPLTSIQHLFLCASAGIKHPRHIKRVIGLTLAKSGKFFLSIPGIRALQPIGKKLLYRLVRVHDYEQASPVMRQTLINVTQKDLRPLLPLINIPTDIFWGTADGMTPVADAYVMRDAIRGSALHVYPGIRHRIHRDKAPEIAAVIKAKIARS